MMTVSPDSIEKELCKYGRAISGEIMQKKYWGIVRIDPLINSPLFAKLRDVLRKRGTGSHAPDRQKNCSPPQRLLCAIDQCIWADLKYFRLKNQNITD